MRLGDGQHSDGSHGQGGLPATRGDDGLSVRGGGAEAREASAFRPAAVPGLSDGQGLNQAAPKGFGGRS